MNINFSVDFLSFLESLKVMNYDYSKFDGESAETAILSVELIKEDPGNGIMSDCLKLTSTSEVKTFYTSQKVTVVRTIEVYPIECGWEPRFIRQEIKKVTIKD